MQKGISIHIGLNEIDQNHYGDNGILKNPENDARSMKGIADSLGYSSTIILTGKATSAKVFEEISKASTKLQSGDILFLTYAGHGSQVPDLNGEEEDNFDETWVLYDRMVADDELHQLFSQFNPGVRIIVLSDSCHSGSVIRFMGQTLTKNKQLFRLLDPVISERCYVNNKILYDGIQYCIPRNVKSKVAASVLLLSGCQDNQLSSDGVGNGLFTAKLLDIYNAGTFNGNYKSFYTQIKSLMPSEQTPNYFFIGSPNQSFENEKPFSMTNGRGLSNETNSKEQSRCKFEIEIPDKEFRIFNENEFEEKVRMIIPDMMTEAFIKLKDAQSIIPELRSNNHRGIEWGAGCSVDKGGWSCSGGIKGSF